MSAPPYAFGVIPARGGSKGLPGKNLRKLGALSLLGQAIASARESALLTRFIVSTDSEEIAAEAERQGLPVPFLRPAELATDRDGETLTLGLGGDLLAIRGDDESRKQRGLAGG